MEPEHAEKRRTTSMDEGDWGALVGWGIVKGRSRGLRAANTMKG